MYGVDEHYLICRNCGEEADYIGGQEWNPVSKKCSGQRQSGGPITERPIEVKDTVQYIVIDEYDQSAKILGEIFGDLVSAGKYLTACYYQEYFQKMKLVKNKLDQIIQKYEGSSQR